MTLANKVLTVGELSGLLKGFFNGEMFQGFFLEGEILSKTVRMGHVYLELGDPNDVSLRKPVMRAIIWKSVAARIFVSYGIGDLVTAKGNLDYYQGNSSVSFIVSSLSVKGSKEGMALLLKKKLLAKLDAMGALSPERKRALPRFVNRLAIVSSAEAAGYHDILNALSRRFPVQEARLFPAVVQGSQAPDSIAGALAKAYAWKPDALILARGGGSKTDLSCFDDERVAMAILASPCPVITAIGHEIDVSVADRVADKVAITPTDAANLVNPSLEELLADVSGYRKAIQSRLSNAVDQRLLMVADLKDRLNRLLPLTKIEGMGNRLAGFKAQLGAELSNAFKRAELVLAQDRNGLKERVNRVLNAAGQNLVQCRKALGEAMARTVSDAETRLGSYRSVLRANSVEKALRKGFVLPKGKDGKLLRFDRLTVGESFALEFEKGVADVVATHKKAKGGQ